MSDKAIHLGDGAYASVTADGNVCISANNHYPEQAIDAVYFDRYAAFLLIEFFKEELEYA